MVYCIVYEYMRLRNMQRSAQDMTENKTRVQRAEDKKNPKNKKRKKPVKKTNGGGLENIRWGAVILLAILIVVAMFVLVFGLRACAARINRDEPVILQPVATPTQAAEDEPVHVVEVTPEPTAAVATGASIADPIDLSEGIVSIQSQESNINTPDVFGHEMVYSAGTGSLLKPLLKTLYLYDLDSDTETKVAEVKLKDGEIFETVLNNDYIAWLDTDQSGKNAIYVLDRNEENAQPRLIKECSFAVPKLRLSQDFLMWIEQNEEKEERLYVVDLISEENASIPGFIESIERMMSTYGVSAPGIYNTQIIWAGSDPNQSEEDSILNGEKSAIYYCDLEMFAEDDYEPGVFCPDMYVHDPITNGEAWAWIDKNKAPDSSLYLKVGDEVKCIAQGVITYALGDDMLVFGQDGGIYAYFYEENLYARLNRPGERGIMPVVSGRRVVWFNKSADGDALEYLSLALREE